MKIQVTQDDIDQGAIQDCYRCPVAIAINRVLKPDYSCEVGTKDIYIRQRCTSIGAFVSHLKTPTKAAEFIRNFDRGIHPEINMTRQTGVLMVGPFHFYLDIPEILLAATNGA